MYGYFFETKQAADTAADQINKTFVSPEGSKTKRLCEVIVLKNDFYIPFSEAAEKTLNVKPVSRNDSHAIND